MTNKRNTVPILFNAGSYGTFVEWCLNYFSGKIGDSLPFTATGSSHQFVGNHFMNIKNWRRYLTSNSNHKFVRFHPKTGPDDNIISNLEEVLLTVDTAVFLYPGKQSTLLTINNKFDKIWSDGWLAHNTKLIEKNINAWGATNVSDMDPWELREFLSLFIVKHHCSEVGQPEIESYTNQNLIKVEIRELVDSFEHTIRMLIERCGCEVKRNNFDEIYNAWRSTQIHLEKDRLVDLIIQKVINKEYYDWSDVKLSIVDESFIQMQLRELYGMHLKCYNLNVFPTNTDQLIALVEQEA